MREILMVGSANIRTPTMEVCLRDASDAAEKGKLLKLKFNKVHLSQVSDARLVAVDVSRPSCSLLRFLSSSFPPAFPIICGHTNGIEYHFSILFMSCRSSSFNPTVSISLLNESFHLVFCLPLHLFPGTGASNMLLSMCHSSPLLTCAYHLTLSPSSSLSLALSSTYCYLPVTYMLFHMDFHFGLFFFSVC